MAWRSGSVMDCHATARGSIPGGNGVKTKWDVKHSQVTIKFNVVMMDNQTKM